MSNDTYNRLEIGRIGVNWVFYQLARIKQCGVKVDELFDYDIISSTNKRLEVKTSTHKTRTKKRGGGSYSWKSWSFLNSDDGYYFDKHGFKRHKPVARDRECDFFIFVCLDDKYGVKASYVVPKDIIGTRKSIVIGDSREKGWLNEYKNNWEQLRKR